MKPLLAVVAAVLAAAICRDFWLPVDYSSLVGNNVLVCGASTGIGRSLALEYVARGANVIITSRSKKKLDLVAEEAKRLISEHNYDSQVYVVPANLEDEDECEKLIALALSLFNKRLDILVLNHIRPYFDLVKNSSPQLLKSVLNVNLVSYVLLAKHALNPLIQSAGSIVAVSSVAGKIGVPYCAVYSAAKVCLFPICCMTLCQHGIHGFFDALRVELDMMNAGNANVSITLAVIGTVNTESAVEVSKGVLDEYNREEPEDVARAIIAGQIRKVREVYYPLSQTFFIPYLHVLFPELTDWLVRNNMNYRA